MLEKLEKRKKFFLYLVYFLFSTGIAYAFFAFIKTPKTLEYMEQRRLYAIESWVIFGIMAIFILINLNHEISENSRSTKKDKTKRK